MLVFWVIYNIVLKYMSMLISYATESLIYPSNLCVFGDIPKKY